MSKHLHSFSYSHRFYLLEKKTSNAGIHFQSTPTRQLWKRKDSLMKSFPLMVPVYFQSIGYHDWLVVFLIFYLQGDKRGQMNFPFHKTNQQKCRKEWVFRTNKTNSERINTIRDKGEAYFLFLYICTHFLYIKYNIL